LATIEKIRRTIGEHNFPGQYQQPRRRGARPWSRRRGSGTTRPTSGREKFDRIAQRRDTANKASEISDFGVCTSWGIRGKDLNLSHVLRKRMQYPELKRAVRDQRQAFEASPVLIEGKAFSTQLTQDRLHAVISHQPQSARSCACTPGRDDRERFVHLATDTAWLAGYLHELTAFPRRGAMTT